MSKPTPPQSKSSSSHLSRKSNKPSSDARFAALQTNPIFRFPSRKHQKVALDSRFQHVLSSEDFTRKARVDKYGRPLSSKAGRKELERFYRLDEDEELQKEGLDDDNEVQRELRRVEQNVVDEEVYDPARQGGYSESSSSEEESSDSDSEDIEDIEDQEEDVRGQAKDVPEGEVTNRLAAVNMDWDNIRAADIMAVAQSFCGSVGRIQDVTVYPSEYGRERMEREQMEGPPKELFASKKYAGQTKAETESLDDRDEDLEDEDEEAIKRRLQKEQAAEPESLDASSKALRQYQLTRLRYYYAVITASSASTAHELYNQMDGREYSSTSNFFDLRFIPDNVTFDDPVTDKPRESCAEIPLNYKPNEFVTDALTHSKVRLTWDEDDRGRGEAQKRAFAGAGEDDDLRAYVGSESSGSEDEGNIKAPAEPNPQDVRSSKQEIARRKTRALLGLAEGEADSQTKKDEPLQGDMQITFSSGLGGSHQNGIFANKPEDVREGSTREKYIRRERERKQKRKDKMKATRSGEAPPAQEAKEDQSSEDVEAGTEDGAEQSDEEAFDDPFFIDPAAANESLKREAKKSRKKRDAEQTAQQREQQAKEREDLRRLMNDGGTQVDGDHQENSHFDMGAIRKAEKLAAKRGKKARKAAKEAVDEGGKPADDFTPDLGDERFKGLFENTEYAIDPTNPRYSGTKAMKRIMEEGRKKRDRSHVEEERPDDGATKRVKRKANGGEIDGLVEKLKKAEE